MLRPGGGDCLDLGVFSLRLRIHPYEIDYLKNVSFFSAGECILYALICKLLFPQAFYDCGFCFEVRYAYCS